MGAAAAASNATVAAAAVAAPTKPMKAAACAAAARLSASVVRSGTVEAGAGGGAADAAGLAFPAVAVAPNGAAVVAAVYSGRGRAPDGRSGGFPGVGAALVAADARGAQPLAPLARSAAPLLPPAAAGAPAPAGAGATATATTAAGAGWAELSAADVHPATGAVYIAGWRGGSARAARAGVASWVGVVAPVGAAA